MSGSFLNTGDRGIGKAIIVTVNAVKQHAQHKLFIVPGRMPEALPGRPRTQSTRDEERRRRHRQARQARHNLTLIDSASDARTGVAPRSRDASSDMAR
jgi:hypothetical protein